MSWCISFTLKIGKDTKKTQVVEIDTISYKKRHFMCTKCPTKWWDIDVTTSKCPSCGSHSNTIIQRT